MRLCPHVAVLGHPLNPGPFTIKEHVSRLSLVPARPPALPPLGRYCARCGVGYPYRAPPELRRRLRVRVRVRVRVSEAGCEFECEFEFEFDAAGGGLGLS